MAKDNIKSFTIRDARFDDIDKFNDIKDRKRLTAGGLFELLLNNNIGENTNNGNVNASNDEIDLLKGTILNYKDLHQKLISICADYKNQFDNNELDCVFTALEQKQKTIEVEKKLTGTQFILEPSEELAKKMHRCILYNIKQGKMNKVSQDLPEQFAKKAIEYFIKNEYNHILK